MIHLRTVAHYQPADSLERSSPRKYFTFALLDTRRPLAYWLAPRVIDAAPTGRRIVKLDMGAPIPDSKNEIPMPGEVLYPPGSPERCVHKSPALPPAERKKANAKYMARRRDGGIDW